MTPLSQDTKFWRLLAAWRDADPAYRDAAGRAIEEYTEGLIATAGRLPDPHYTIVSTPQPDGTVLQTGHQFAWQRHPASGTVAARCACGWHGLATGPAAARLAYQQHLQEVAKP